MMRQEEIDAIKYGEEREMTTEAALKELHDRLTKHKESPYFFWTPINENMTLYLREPNRKKNEDEGWMREERAEIIHICAPVLLIEAVERRDKSASFEYCGYVRTGTCTRCNAVVIS